MLLGHLASQASQKPPCRSILSTLCREEPRMLEPAREFLSIGGPIWGLYRSLHEGSHHFGSILGAPQVWNLPQGKSSAKGPKEVQRITLCPYLQIPKPLFCRRPFIWGFMMGTRIQQVWLWWSTVCHCRKALNQTTANPRTPNT